MIDVRHTDNADESHGLPSLADASVDHVITDPPYSAYVHGKIMRSRWIPGESSPEKNPNGERGARKVALDFDHLDENRRRWLGEQFARVVRRWCVVFCDHESSVAWSEALSRGGLDYVRTGVWIKAGSTPQFSGDRPGTGHECLVIAHRKGRKRWNGGGRLGVWQCPIVKGGNERVHTTQKPLELMEALVRDFTNPGELVLDPFCGSGTTLVAARRLGRSCMGMEIDPGYATIAHKRVSQTRQQVELNF